MREVGWILEVDWLWLVGLLGSRAGRALRIVLRMITYILFSDFSFLGGERGFFFVVVFDIRV